MQKTYRGDFTLEHVYDDNYDLFDSLYEYDPHTGLLLSKRSSRVLKALDDHGYIRARYTDAAGKRRVHLAHRVAFTLFYGWCPVIVDHRNNVRTDNRLHNLRPATFKDNAVNCILGTNRVGFKGVTKVGKRYRAMIRVNGKKKHLGYFYHPEAAAAAYQDAALKHHGQYANFS